MRHPLLEIQEDINRKEDSRSLSPHASSSLVFERTVYEILPPSTNNMMSSTHWPSEFQPNDQPHAFDGQSGQPLSGQALSNLVANFHPPGNDTQISPAADSIAVHAESGVSIDDMPTVPAGAVAIRSRRISDEDREVLFRLARDARKIGLSLKWVAGTPTS